MALQNSGQISLNDIHVEAGGSSGTQAGINDSDIRGLISASSATEMEFADFYGASSSASFVGAVTKRVGTDADLDSSSQSLNLTGAGVQAGDLVVIAVTADTQNYTSVGWSGMSLTTQSDLINGNTSLPAAFVSYGFWTSGNSNPYFNFSGGAAGGRLKAVSIVAGIFRNTNSSILNFAGQESTTQSMPNPPSLSYVSGSTSIIICTGHLDDDEITMTAPTGYTLSGSIATNSSTRGGVTGSSCAMAHKITTANTTENPGGFAGGGSDNRFMTTLRF